MRICNLICVAVVIGLTFPAVAVNAQDQFVFSAREFNLGIDATVTFTCESENLCRVEWSETGNPYKDPMLLTYLLSCAARSVALSSGFDRYGLLPIPGNGSSGMVFFLRPGETVADVLGTEYENVPLVSVDDPNIHAPCGLPSE